MYRSFVYRIALPFDAGFAYLCKSRKRSQVFVFNSDNQRVLVGNRKWRGLGESLPKVFEARLADGLKPIAQFVTESGAFEYAPYKRSEGRSPLPAPKPEKRKSRQPDVALELLASAARVEYDPDCPICLRGITHTLEAHEQALNRSHERDSEFQAEQRAANYLYGFDRE